MSGLEPTYGSHRYRIRFAWLPTWTRPAEGIDYGWSAKVIWLRRVVEEQTYLVGPTRARWLHSGFFPLNDFTQAQITHNNEVGR